jgi:hypothetical protein
MPLLAPLTQVNGYFELSSNRRDIWYGGDMQGIGRLRSQWNENLLTDVIAPSYVRVLLEVCKVIERPQDVYRLWPQLMPAGPWGTCSSLATVAAASLPCSDGVRLGSCALVCESERLLLLYSSACGCCASSGVVVRSVFEFAKRCQVLFTNANGGEWISPEEAVLIDGDADGGETCD